MVERRRSIIKTINEWRIKGEMVSYGKIVQRAKSNSDQKSLEETVVPSNNSRFKLKCEFRAKFECSIS
jgi:hypothetical protein